MDKQQFIDMSLAELTELVGEEIAEAIVDQRHNDTTDIPEGEYTDEEWDELQTSRCYVEEDKEVSFTDMAKDSDLMATFNEVEVQTIRRWVEVEALRDHYALFEDFLFD